MPNETGTARLAFPFPRRPRGGHASGRAVLSGGSDAAVPSPPFLSLAWNLGCREAEGEGARLCGGPREERVGARQEASAGTRFACPPRTPGDAGTRVTGASFLGDTSTHLRDGPDSPLPEPRAWEFPSLSLVLLTLVPGKRRNIMAF